MFVVVKLGGSAITDKAKAFSFRRESAEIFAEKIKALREMGVSILIVHGGGSFGHPVALRYGLHEGGNQPEKLLGFAETRYRMTELSQLLVRSLLDHGIPAVAVQTSAITVAMDEALRYMDLEPIERFLKMGLVPLLCGDVVPDIKRGMSVLSGDAISAHLACRLRASALIFVMGAGGIYTKPPSTPGAVLVRELRSESGVILGDARGIDITGGVAKKLHYAFEAARCGTRVTIGGVSHLVEMALGLDAPYTTVVPG
ncbi:MAG: isopentenyl phosphate kinase [Thermofilum sp.]